MVAHLLELALVVGRAAGGANGVDADTIWAFDVVDALGGRCRVVGTECVSTTELGFGALEVGFTLESAEAVHTVLPDAAVFVRDAEVRSDAANAMKTGLTGLAVGAGRAEYGVLCRSWVDTPVVLTDLTFRAVRGVSAEALALTPEAVAAGRAVRVGEADRVGNTSTVFAALAFAAVLTEKAGADWLRALAREADQAFDTLVVGGAKLAELRWVDFLFGLGSGVGGDIGARIQVGIEIGVHSDVGIAAVEAGVGTCVQAGVFVALATPFGVDGSRAFEWWEFVGHLVHADSAPAEVVAAIGVQRATVGAEAIEVARDIGSTVVVREASFFANPIFSADAALALGAIDAAECRNAGAGVADGIGALVIARTRGLTNPVAGAEFSVEAVPIVDTEAVFDALAIDADARGTL